jgi:TnpA family transposase
VKDWYLSADCVHNANDRIISQMDEMELPNIYRREKETLHSSSDGQKLEVAVDSLNANYSFEYFGQGRGVSVYSFIDERHFLFHSTVISSAEREAAYVIDGPMNNDVVKSEIHSTDTHGYSEVIFGATFFFVRFFFCPENQETRRTASLLIPERKGL